MQPALFDTVELLVDLPAHNLRSGSLGAIVHAYDDGIYEVEFISAEGETTALCPLSAEQFIVVWQAKTQRWLPIAEHVAALVSHLPEAAGIKHLKQSRLMEGGTFGKDTHKSEGDESEQNRRDGTEIFPIPLQIIRTGNRGAFWQFQHVSHWRRA